MKCVDSITTKIEFCQKKTVYFRLDAFQTRKFDFEKTKNKRKPFHFHKTSMQPTETEYNTSILQKRKCIDVRYVSNTHTSQDFSNSS